MVRGQCVIHAEFYTTDSRGRVSARFNEYGYSEKQSLNTDEQKQSAFKDAVSNAGQKYAYHSKQKYEDLEFNYTLLSTEFIYLPEFKKDTYKLRYNEISPKDKRILHSEVLEKNRIYREEHKGQRDTEYTETQESYERMFAKANEKAFEKFKKRKSK